MYGPATGPRRSASMINNDAALFATVPAQRSGQQLVISVDTLVEDVHFTRETPLDALGYKCVAVNLSDMAAMGATPLSIQCAWSDPLDESFWSEAIERAITQAARDAAATISLCRVAAPRRQICIQIIGETPKGRALTRDGANIGDHLWVSGTLGDAGAGLALLQGQLHTDNREDHATLLDRLHRPTARVALGQLLRGIATAAIDLSDGIAGDASHLTERSGVGLTLLSHRLPLSDALLRVAGESLARRFALSAGEDYELAFTAPPGVVEHIKHAALRAQVPVHCIGEVVAGDSLLLLDEQRRRLAFPGAFDHFANEMAERNALTDDGAPQKDTPQ